MTITIRLTAAEEQRLSERAARDGQDLATYIHRLIERDIQPPVTVEEALTPFRREVEASGMSDSEYDAFFEEVRAEVWREKQAPQSEA